MQTRAKAKKASTYEFGGPLGALTLSIILPLVCYAFAFGCNEISGCPAPSLLYPKVVTPENLKREVGWPGILGLLNREAFLVGIGIYVYSLLSLVLLPAHEVKGVALSSEGKLSYRLNAFNTLLLTFAIVAAGTITDGSEFYLWRFMWDNYVPLLTFNILVSYGLATFCYVRSFSIKSNDKQKRELAPGGHSGNMIYDWFIGRELNPRVTLPLLGEVDIKSFMELRPGFLFWVLLNLTFMARQYRYHGYISDSMLIVVLSQMVYILDALWNEPAILTTMDITTDGFGFMLAFGDLVWVPFFYSLQARYLAVHPVNMGKWSIGILVLLALGYYIFRSANNQKNIFRNDPKDPRVSHLDFINTKRGSKLLVSGWWGQARHINYLGDFVLSWAYCLPTGIAGYIIHHSAFPPDAEGRFLPDSARVRPGQPVLKYVVPGDAKGWGMIFTYSYLIYFAILLVHRERRDDNKCREKYGKDWDEYRRRVPSRIIPGIY